jgi:AcrR family transcriptional regulator
MAEEAPHPSRDRRAERGEATRAQIVRAARELFTERGYAAVATNEVVEHAGVTRGAMYHHFKEKRDLFRAVYEEVEREQVEAAAKRIQGVEDPWEMLLAGMRAFFDACTDPKLMRIGLVDGPAVLGWREWREIGTQYAFGLVTFALRNAMEAGVLREADVEQLAHLLVGALGEAAMVLANSPDPASARADLEATVIVLLEGLRVG